MTERGETGTGAGAEPRIGSVSFSLFHSPFLASTYGTTVEGEREKGEDSPFLRQLPNALRSFSAAVAYPPNQAFIGNLDPRSLPPRPWERALSERAADAGVLSAALESQDEPMQEDARGRFGSIVDETTLFGLVKLADVFGLVSLTSAASDAVRKRFAGHPALAGVPDAFLSKPAEEDAILAEISKGALPLRIGSKLAGCVKAAHPSDPNMTARVMLENLCVKGTAVFTLRDLLARGGIDPASIDYIIETSEEACGDMNQRGGGNFAKAIGELAGCVNATGSDIRSFCAGPVHGILQAASLVKAGTFGRVVVVAGGALAKLGMNGKKHLEKGYPLLEDCLGGFSMLLSGDSADGLFPIIGHVGMHRIGAGSTPQAVISSLVADPIKRYGLSLTDIEYYAPELHNPEITELAGAGNVTLSNLRMIAAMAVMEKRIERTEMDSFIEARGSSGWAPTQGHIPSGIPAVGWLLEWGRAGSVKRSLVIGKGSLFLGRMTNLFDGVSLIMEYRPATQQRSVVAPEPGRDASRADLAVTKAGASAGSSPAASSRGAASSVVKRRSGRVRLGLLVSGSERGEDEMRRGAEEAMKADPTLEIVFCGSRGTEETGKAELDQAFLSGSVDGALAFHYPFPVGTATSAPCVYQASGKPFFLATTTGASASERVASLVQNGVQGVAAAKAAGVSVPSVGFMNLDGAHRARALFGELVRGGYEAVLTGSVRGDELLRGNDLYRGNADVIVCDTLTGNLIVKLFGSVSTRGETEDAGSGYGVGIGKTDRAVAIISRASSARVVAAALLETARMVRADVLGIYAAELETAEAAGLSKLLAVGSRGAAGRPDQGDAYARAGAGVEAGAEIWKNIQGGPEKKPVTREISGIDILLLEEAAGKLMQSGLYCEAGMGCTGPVLLVAPEDEKAARENLKRFGYA